MNAHAASNAGRVEWQAMNARLRRTIVADGRIPTAADVLVGFRNACHVDQPSSFYWLIAAESIEQKMDNSKVSTVDGWYV